MTAAEALYRHHLHPEPGTVHDPVCGMTVNPAKARHRAEHAGQSYFFCGAKCREKFTSDPARYIIIPIPMGPISSSSAVFFCSSLSAA